MCRALPQGLQLAQLSQLQVTLGFSGHRASVPLLPWWRWLGFSPSLLFLCQGAPVAVVSAWVDGAVILLPFPYLRVGVLLACGVSGVCGLRRWSQLPFVVRRPFPVSAVLHLFWGWSGLVTGLWPLLRLLGFGLFWCSVAPSWRLSLWLHPLLLSPWISSLGVCSDLG